MSTIRIEDLPEWYPVKNPLIKSGYRHTGSLYNSALSLFSWHNETLNIYTHLLPGIYFLYQFCIMPVDYTCFVELLEKINYFSAAFMCISSTIYHAFNMVDYTWYTMTLKLDYTGIIVVNLTHQFMDSFLLFYVALNNQTLFLGSLCIEILFAIYCIIDIVYFHVIGRIWNMSLWYPVISSVPLTSITFVYSRIWGSNKLQMASNASLGCSLMIFIAGGIFYKGKFPERFWNSRGIFDNYNSHVWHHIFIVISIFVAMSGFPFMK